MVPESPHQFAENANLLSAAERQQALAELMAVFCTGSAFKGFIGITPDGALYTNRTTVAGLYNGFPSGTSVTFKAIAHDEVVTITGGNLRTVYANTTGSIALIAKLDTFGPNPNLFVGHYQNEWTVNADGSVCISRFHDGALKWFSLTATQQLYRALGLLDPRQHTDIPSECNRFSIGISSVSPDSRLSSSLERIPGLSQSSRLSEMSRTRSEPDDND